MCFALLGLRFWCYGCLWLLVGGCAVGCGILVVVVCLDLFGVLGELVGQIASC